TLGVRGTTLDRWPAARTEGVVEVDGHPVRVKVGAGRVKVEHDDAAFVARATGRPLREVLARAEAAVLPEGPVTEPTPPGGHSHAHGDSHDHSHPHEHGPDAHDPDGGDLA